MLEQACKSLHKRVQAGTSLNELAKACSSKQKLEQA
jgi:hypothetical protein